MTRLQRFCMPIEMSGFDESFSMRAANEAIPTLLLRRTASGCAEMHQNGTIT
jgi:hypothetical protein